MCLKNGTEAIWDIGLLITKEMTFKSTVIPGYVWRHVIISFHTLSRNISLFEFY